MLSVFSGTCTILGKKSAINVIYPNKNPNALYEIHGFSPFDAYWVCAVTARRVSK